MHIFISHLAIVINFQTDDESLACGNYNVDFSMFYIFENQSNQYLCKILSLLLTAYKKVHSLCYCGETTIVDIRKTMFHDFSDSRNTFLHCANVFLGISSFH